MNQKYKFTENTRKQDGHTLHQICSLRDFSIFGELIKAGDLGGWIESEENLNIDDNSWVSFDSRICENAKVQGNSYIANDSFVCGNAVIDRNSKIKLSCAMLNTQIEASKIENSAIKGNIKIKNSCIRNGIITDNVHICNSTVCGPSEFHGSVKVKDSEIKENVKTSGNVIIKKSNIKNAHISENACVIKSQFNGEKVVVKGNACVKQTEIKGNAYISDCAQLLSDNKKYSKNSKPNILNGDCYLEGNVVIQAVRLTDCSLKDCSSVICNVEFADDPPLSLKGVQMRGNSHIEAEFETPRLLGKNKISKIIDCSLQENAKIIINAPFDLENQSLSEKDRINICEVSDDIIFTKNGDHRFLEYYQLGHDGFGAVAGYKEIPEAMVLLDDKYSHLRRVLDQETKTNKRNKIHEKEEMEDFCF